MKTHYGIALLTAAALVAVGGTVANTHASAATANLPIYRIYNHNTGEYFYTDSLAEKKCRCKSWLDLSRYRLECTKNRLCRLSRVQS
ncbi:hypothetical protein ACFO26_07550 [Lactococcus nasutitermitis]|uniref:DUF5648 domain-containing protein n=1 Tax=Lactococcus nasutitermitis TaxID=1652957 RepID=A0ABV9JEJ2_9LACT